MVSRYVDNNYRIVNSGEHFWVSSYNYSGKSLKCTKFRVPVEVMINDKYEIVNVPGYKGRKIPSYYYGYLYSTERLALQSMETDIKAHLMLIQDTIESIIESLQGVCKRDSKIRSMREVDDIKQSLLKYAQIL